jgi:hypothetical protein
MIGDSGELRRRSRPANSHPCYHECLAVVCNDDDWLGSFQIWKLSMDAARRKVLLKRKQEDDENWLLKYTGRLSFREQKAREQLLEKRKRSEKARMKPIIVDDEDDNCRGVCIEMLPIPSASSPPLSKAPVVIIDLEGDDEEGVGASTVPSLPSSNLDIKIEQNVHMIDNPDLQDKLDFQAKRSIHQC